VNIAFDLLKGSHGVFLIAQFVVALIKEKQLGGAFHILSMLNRGGWITYLWGIYFLEIKNVQEARKYLLRFAPELVMQSQDLEKNQRLFQLLFHQDTPLKLHEYYLRQMKAFSDLNASAEAAEFAQLALRTIETVEGEVCGWYIKLVVLLFNRMMLLLGNEFEPVYFCSIWIYNNMMRHMSNSPRLQSTKVVYLA
jgi:hypothetical protein